MNYQFKESKTKETSPIFVSEKNNSERIRLFILTLFQEPLRQ